MRIIASTLTAAIAANLISGCSGNTPQGASGMLPQPLAQSQARLSRTVEHNGKRIEPLTTQDTYLADAGSNQVTAYDHSGNWVCTIKGSQSELNGPDFITFDTSDTLYVANQKGNTVTEYGPCQTAPIQTLNSPDISSPTAIAIGSAGNVYIANEGNSSVTEYSGGSVVQQLVQNINKPRALVFDSEGNLYVANAGTPKAPNGWVTVCPHGTQCDHTITSSDIDNPRALAIDSLDNVYVANDIVSPNGSVSEHRPYAKGNGYVTTYGLGALDSPNAVVFDNGHLCVSSNGNNEVICFTSGGSVYAILTNQKDGVDNPQSLAASSVSKWLSVANESGGIGKGSLTKYCDTFTNCMITATKNVSGPVSIAIEP